MDSGGQPPMDVVTQLVMERERRERELGSTDEASKRNEMRGDQLND